ncbi:MAG: hypothetical protein WAO09_04710 [Candidatus Dormiibacterota bacterium]
MVTFIALYRGPTVAEVEVVAVSADPELVSELATRLLQRPILKHGDPALALKHRHERKVLRVVRDDVRAASGRID